MIYSNTQRPERVDGIVFIPFPKSKTNTSERGRGHHPDPKTLVTKMMYMMIQYTHDA